MKDSVPKSFLRRTEIRKQPILPENQAVFTYSQHHPVINRSEDQLSFREMHKTTSEATPGVQRTSASEAMVLLENDDALPLLLFVGVFEPRDPVRTWPRVTE